MFGRGFSGLLYDYQGLVRLYRETNRQQEMHEYANKLLEWNETYDRESSVEALSDPLDFLGGSCTEPNNSLTDCSALIKESSQICSTLSEKDSLLNKSVLSRDWSCPRSKSSQSTHNS